MRLGANCVVNAIKLSDRVPEAVVLWDPIVNGQAYLDELLLSNRRAAAKAFKRSIHQFGGTKISPGESNSLSEAMGFVLPAEFRRDIERIDSADFATVNVATYTLCTSNATTLASISRALASTSIGFNGVTLASHLSKPSDDSGVMTMDSSVLADFLIPEIQRATQ